MEPPLQAVKTNDPYADLNRLNRPTSVVISPDGAIYVANKGTTMAGGEVLASNHQRSDGPLRRPFRAGAARWPQRRNVHNREVTFTRS